MNRFAEEKWKYLSIGLLAILAVGFSFPQAFAHVTNSLSHNIGHILAALTPLQSDVTIIKAKTDNLPSDPASETTSGEIQDTTSNIESILTLKSVNEICDLGSFKNVLVGGTGDILRFETVLVRDIDQGATWQIDAISGLLVDSLGPSATQNAANHYVSMAGPHGMPLTTTAFTIQASGAAAVGDVVGIIVYYTGEGEVQVICQ